MGLPDSRRVSRDPRYLGVCSRRSNFFRLQGCHLLWLRLSSRNSPRSSICNLPGDPQDPQNTPLNPARTTVAAYDMRTVWAVPRSLAATSGIATCFLFLRLLRCFSSPGWPRTPMYSAHDHQGSPGGVSPFGHPRVSLLPADRGLSQVATSFIASWCQGIHRTPFLAWSKTKTSILADARPRVGRHGAFYPGVPLANREST